MDFNHYFTNEELNHLLDEWVATYPDLIQVSSIGNSHEGRPIWLLTLTNRTTGSDMEKPAIWIE